VRLLVKGKRSQEITKKNKKKTKKEKKKTAGRKRKKNHRTFLGAVRGVCCQGGHENLGFLENGEGGRVSGRPAHRDYKREGRRVSVLIWTGKIVKDIQKPGKSPGYGPHSAI